MFKNGVIDVPNFFKVITNAYNWPVERGYQFEYFPKVDSIFETRYELLKMHVPNFPNLNVVNQIKLPLITWEANNALEGLLREVSRVNGEGLIVRSPYATYCCERTHDLLKVKKLDDAEGVVTGYITGRETDKGSKLLGMMGALVVDFNGKRLELSGFTDEERRLTSVDVLTTGEVANDWAKNNPETECPGWIYAEKFPRGTTVTFRYRGLSKDGIPQEARYWRKR
jgi:ATP-dependent DNA ligase